MKNTKIRSIVVSVVFVLAFTVFIGVLFKVQVIDKDKHTKNTVKSYSITVDAARGEILDRNGSPLVTNRQGNSIIFNYAYFPKEQEERDEIILSLVKLFEENIFFQIFKNLSGDKSLPSHNCNPLAILFLII